MLRRGDVVLVRFPFSSGAGAKIRPALVVQCDANNRRLANTIIAMITTTTTHAASESTQFLIAIATPVGQQSGLLHDSAAKCENLFTVEQQLVLRTIGSLPAAAMSQVGKCLTASLELK
jgi:mRNA-degrading endonuclease toxin of MazEF toxin-antitoxin module